MCVCVHLFAVQSRVLQEGGTGFAPNSLDASRVPSGRTLHYKIRCVVCSKEMFTALKPVVSKIPIIVTLYVSFEEACSA